MIQEVLISLRKIPVELIKKMCNEIKKINFFLITPASTFEIKNMRFSFKNEKSNYFSYRNRMKFFGIMC